MRRKASKRSPIWKGHAAMNAVDALQTWDMREAWQISIDLAKAIDGNHMLNVDTAINLLCKLDYMKEHHAFGLLRVLSRSDIALESKGDVEKHAKKMNTMVGFLFDVLPYEELKKRVRQQPELKHVEIGDAPLLYCVTGKALVTLSILPAIEGVVRGLRCKKQQWTSRASSRRRR